MSESHSATPPMGPSTPSAPTAPASSAARIRLLVLVGLLGLMAGALWYDYKVARPAVENAYARITQLNSDVNSRAGRKYLTNKDVQNELKRAPIETFSEGGYFVEVYGWRAGLPIKTHNYYAVYTDGAPYVFLKHYMTKIEMDELRPLLVPPGPGAESTEIVTATSVPPGPGFGAGKKGKGKKANPDSESAVPGEGTKVAGANETPGDAAPSVPESAAPAKAPVPPDSNADDKKESAASSAEATPAIEKPAADKSQPKG